MLSASAPVMRARSHLPRCERERHRQNCCVCAALAQIDSNQRLISEIEALLNGESNVRYSLQIHLSMLPAECTSRCNAMKGIIAELHAVACLHEHFGYEFDGWTHRSKFSPHLFGSRDGMNITVSTRPIKDIPLGYRSVPGLSVESSQEIDLIFSKWSSLKACRRGCEIEL